MQNFSSTIYVFMTVQSIKATLFSFLESTHLNTPVAILTIILPFLLQALFSGSIQPCVPSLKVIGSSLFVLFAVVPLLKNLAQTWDELMAEEVDDKASRRRDHPMARGLMCY